MADVPRTDSKERVAYDLMRFCAEREGLGRFTTREEVLKLYDQCLTVARGQGYDIAAFT